MTLLRVGLISVVGYSALIALATRLLRRPTTSPTRFAALLSSGLAAVHSAIVVTALPMGRETLIIALLVTVGPFVVGFPVAHWLFRAYHRRMRPADER